MQTLRITPTPHPPSPPPASRSNPESRRVLTHGVAGKEEASGLPSAEPPANARIVDGCSFLPFPTPARVGSRARRSSCNASRGGDPEYGSASTPEDAPRKESSTLPNPRQDLFSPCTPALSARSDSSSAAESNGEATASVRSLSIPDLESVTGEESWDPVGWQVCFGHIPRLAITTTTLRIVGGAGRFAACRIESLARTRKPCCCCCCCCPLYCFGCYLFRIGSVFR